MPDLLQVNRLWLDEFQAKHGRVPRILHIGNIANNAYLNAKYLRSVGVECDVLCYDYYHVMSCPEWEDAEFDSRMIADQARPDWAKVDLHGFVRPIWFAQGTLTKCIDYLIARQTGKTKKADYLWQELSYDNGTSARPENKMPENKIEAFANYLQAIALRLLKDKHIIDFLEWRLGRTLLGRKGYLEDLFSPLIVGASLMFVFLLRLFYASWRIVAGKRHFDEDAARLVSGFALTFPQREDKLSVEEIIPLRPIHSRVVELLNCYDLIQGYATDGVYPMLVGAEYVAFEHGTIRNIPFERTTQGRLCALTYRMADAVIITNADNLLGANKLGLERFYFVPHPINDNDLQRHIDAGEKLYESLHAELKADFIVFHPARQHWESVRHTSWEKGNDFLIEAFAQFVKKCNPNAGAVFVEWGKSVDKSKELLKSLGVEGRVKWIAPLAHLEMIRYVAACDVLADQFYLGAFGSTMPKALACGRPALIYLNIELHRWCFPEMPPVLNVRTSEEIFEGLCRLYRDEGYRDMLGQSGKAWYSKWHSSSKVVNSLVDIYRRVL